MTGDLGAVPHLDGASFAAWRRQTLAAAGFGERLAAQLAGDARIDLHALLELVDAGCAGRGGAHPRAAGRRLGGGGVIGPGGGTVRGVGPLPADAPVAARRAPDAESRAWLAALASDGRQREEAIARLHDLLLRAARFEIGRRRAALAQVRGEELEDLATQAADDALVVILGKSDQYRGESRFTTWGLARGVGEAAPAHLA